VNFGSAKWKGDGRQSCEAYGEIDKRRVIIYTREWKREGEREREGSDVRAHVTERSELAKAVTAWDERLDNCRVAVVGENRTPPLLCLRMCTEKKRKGSFPPARYQIRG